MTTEAPPPITAQIGPTDPAAAAYPDAVPVLLPGSNVSIVTPPEGSQSHEGNIYTLDRGTCADKTSQPAQCAVVITFGERVLRADHIEYDKASGDVTLNGHVVIDIASTNEHIEASHGTLNMNTETGRFYDVSGSVGLKSANASGGAHGPQRAVYANTNPFLFTGKMVVKTGPRQFRVYGGTFTSCQLPRPDWLLSGKEFSIDGDTAHATNPIFRLMGLPLLWLPYVTHPVDTSNRQTGFLIPEIGFNSASKGTTIGEQLYWVINRSTDLTVGSIYYSARGYEETASFRHRGLGENFLRARYSGLQDRGYYPGGGSVYVNQGGTDVLFSGRHDFLGGDDSGTDADAAPVHTRAVADVEYLSSFPYREAFSSNFNQAVSSDVVSTVYATREWNGMAASLEGDRYQGEKRVQSKSVSNGVVQVVQEQQVHIFHAPSLEFTTVDHLLGATGLDWNLNATVAALKRTQPNFRTSGMVERLDLRPELTFPFGGGGWRVLPSIAGRETFYSRSRVAAVPGTGIAPVESTSPLNRADVDVQLDIRPPVLERTFDSGFIRNLFHRDVRHTIEPDFTYRYISGIGNFANVLRFDSVDIASNTNEMEYGITQRLFLRRSDNQPCRAPGTFADATAILDLAGKEEDAIEDPGESAGRTETAAPVCGNREFISWRVAQKYFFNQTFGGAVVFNGPRSILNSTLAFSGISFLTGPRDISPLISRLRVRTTEKLDFEWDFDFDMCSAAALAAASSNSRPCVQKFTADNIFVEFHQGNFSAGSSYARLNAPARSIVEGVPSAVADFNQMRFHVGFGKPTKQGLSAAASAGIDLDLGSVQYGAIQTSYNWNCCGISLEYSKYELGTTRNDNGYKFNFTLANIGSAGNLRHAEQVF
ncbi:MAG TPA: LPS assembly protein LptD [Acidobacteriaceae bacterium]